MKWVIRHFYFIEGKACIPSTVQSWGQRIHGRAWPMSLHLEWVRDRNLILSSLLWKIQEVVKIIEAVPHMDQLLILLSWFSSIFSPEITCVCMCVCARTCVHAHTLGSVSSRVAGSPWICSLSQPCPEHVLVSLPGSHCKQLRLLACTTRPSSLFFFMIRKQLKVDGPLSSAYTPASFSSKALHPWSHHLLLPPSQTPLLFFVW